MPLDGQHLPELPLLRFRRKSGNFFRLPDDHDFHPLIPSLPLHRFVLLSASAF
jgi:hypothetical protein